MTVMIKMTDFVADEEAVE